MMRQYYTKLALVLFCLGSLQATDLTKQPSDKVKNEAVVQTSSAQPSSKALTNTTVPQECKILFDKLSDEEQNQVRAMYEANKKKKWKACLLAIFGGQALYLKSHRVVGLLTFIFLFFGIIGLRQKKHAKGFITKDFGRSFVILWIFSLVVEWCTLLFSHSIKNENIRLFQQALEKTTTYKQTLKEALAKAKDPMYAQVPQRCLPYVLALSDEAQQEAVGLFKTQQKSLFTACWLAWFGGHNLYMKRCISEGIVIFITIVGEILSCGVAYSKNSTNKGVIGVLYAGLFLIALSWLIVYTTLSATIEQVNTAIFLKQMLRAEATKTKSV